MSNKFENEVKDMSMSDLYAIFNYISIDYHKQFGQKSDIKELVRSRYNVVLEELNKRAYGRNPYVDTSVEYEGEKPENIDLSKFEFDEKGKK